MSAPTCLRCRPTAPPFVDWNDAPVKLCVLHAAAPDLLAALEELVARCDGEEGIRHDGSNIQTMRAHAALRKAREGDQESIMRAITTARVDERRVLPEREGA